MYQFTYFPSWIASDVRVLPSNLFCQCPTAIKDQTKVRCFHHLLYSSSYMILPIVYYYLQTSSSRMKKMSRSLLTDLKYWAFIHAAQIEYLLLQHFHTSLNPAALLMSRNLLITKPHSDFGLHNLSQAQACIFSLITNLQTIFPVSWWLKQGICRTESTIVGSPT